jgi:hypothetical protein
MSRHGVPKQGADADRSKFNAKFLQASCERLVPGHAPRDPLLLTMPK